MDKKDLGVLERIFENDVKAALGEGPNLPTQFHHRMTARLERLEREGYIRRDEAKLGGRFPMTVSGWALTTAGHATYCMSCREQREGGSE